MFILIITGFIIQKKEFVIQFKIIGFYIFGLFCYSFSIVLYSMYLDPLVYGYALVISPFSHKELNSPAINNNMAIVFSFFYYQLIFFKFKF